MALHLARKNGIKHVFCRVKNVAKKSTVAVHIVKLKRADQIDQIDQIDHDMQHIVWIVPL